MRIEFQPDKAGKISADFLEVTKTLRSVGYEIGDVARELRNVPELDAIRRELRRQETALMQEAVRAASLSAALDEITELYGRAEQRNEDRLAAAASYQAPGQATPVSAGQTAGYR